MMRVKINNFNFNINSMMGLFSTIQIPDLSVSESPLYRYFQNLPTLNASRCPTKSCAFLKGRSNVTSTARTAAQAISPPTATARATLPPKTKKSLWERNRPKKVKMLLFWRQNLNSESKNPTRNVLLLLFLKLQVSKF